MKTSLTRTLNRHILPVLLFGMLVTFSAILNAQPAKKAGNSVVDIIVNSENHNTLEAAVKAAGLAGTLSGDGPFTVFAPTDDAFAALPAGTIDALLADPSGDLTDILLYHVIGAKVMSTDLSDGQMAETLLGKDVKVTINNDGVFINDAKVTVADIQADNGVVHVIDIVLVYKDETLGIFQNKTEEMKVYPNPASDYVKVHFDGSESYTVRLLSLDGKTIKRFENVGSDSNLKLSDVQNGTYMLLSEGTSSRAVSKILIQR